jgi:RNA polymerase sigma factor (sigma-70 family)
VSRDPHSTQVTGFPRAVVAATDIAARLYSRWTREEREDLVQDVLVKYLRTWSDGEGPDNLDAWLTTVTRNTAVSLNAARARREDPLVPVVNGVDADPIDLLFTLASPWLTSFQAISHELVESFLALVSEREREIIRLKHLHKRSAADIGEELGMAANAVDQAASRAVKHLRSAAEQRPDLIAELRNPHPRVY